MFYNEYKLPNIMPSVKYYKMEVLKEESFMKRLRQWIAMLCTVTMLAVIFPQERVQAAPGDIVNGNFETGDLTGWSVVSGDLQPQPTIGRTEVDFKKEGSYFIGTCEITGGVARRDFNDKLTGVIKSDPFTIVKPYLSFMIGGGNNLQDRYVALVRESDGTELLKATGQNSEEFSRVDWDVTSYLNEQVAIKIVDNTTGPWGHINADKFRQVAIIPASDQISILDTQIGFQPNAKKQVVLRSAVQNPTPNPAGTTFQVIRVENAEEVFAGTVEYWGAKWGSYWWTLDFTDLTDKGEYYVTIGEDRNSNNFKIDDQVLIEESLVPVAIDQLDDRLKNGVGGWRDCGSEIREVSSHVVTIHGLVDVYEKAYDSLSSAKQQELIDKIIWGSDYIVSSQDTTSDPRTNGRFNHDIARQTPYNTSNYYNWHDMAYCITGLVRAYEVIKDHNPSKATTYLNSAKKAYDCATYRPYHLQSEFNGVVAADYNYMLGYARPQWNKPSSWVIPTTLRTKDKLAFLWGCTLLYKATGDAKYKDSAISYAESVMERQFVDYENPIEGAYGNFYEYEGDNEAFMIEFGQNHRWLMGNIEPTNLRGFMDLAELFPEDNRVAQWYNTVKIFGENYVKTTAELNPFGIYPSAVYPGAGDITFFKGMLHGGTGLYGQIAKNQLEIADFLEDESYQQYASNNVQFVAGLNPGLPNQYNATRWTAKTLLKNIGTNSFNGQGSKIDPPDGSGMNGFSAFGQFQMPYPNTGIDQPAGILKPDGSIYFNEDYLPHSHGYVSGITTLENEFDLKVITKDGGSPVAASIEIELPETYNFTTSSQGTLSVDSLPLERSGVIKATYNGHTIKRDLATMGSGDLTWEVDFSSYVNLDLDVPSTIKQSEEKTGQLTVANKGTTTTTVQVKLSGGGVNVSSDPISVTVEPGQSATQDFTLTGGAKIMPYLVHAQLLGDTQEMIATDSGKVKEGEAPPPLFNSNITNWQVYDGTWQDVVGGKQGTKTYGDGSILAGEQVTDFTYEADIKVTTHGPVAGSAGTLLFRSKDNPYQGTYAVNVQTSGKVSLFRFPYKVIENYSTTINKDQIYHLKVTMTGSQIKVYLDGTKVIDVNDTTYTQGKVGLMSYDGTAIYQNVMLDK